MIGRAAQGRPWILGEIANGLLGRPAPAPPGPAAVCAILCEHLEALHAFYGEAQGVRIARKHLGWYARDRPENAAFRQVVNAAETAELQLRLTRDYFDRLAERPALAA
jgi:tRNA-dihydrouridine synthase B